MQVVGSKIVLFSFLLLFTQSNCSSKPSNQPQAIKPAESTPNQVVVLNDAEITAKIRGIVAKILNLESNLVDVNAPLTKQKNPADELDIVEIIMEVEETFRIEIKDEEIGGSTEQIRELSVNKLTEIVAKKKPRKNPAPTQK